MEYKYNTSDVCSKEITFNIENDRITNISFLGGCNGNLKLISKILNNKTVDEIEALCKGNICGRRPTSCGDQLAIAVRKASDELNSKC